MANIFELTEWPTAGTYLYEQHAETLHAHLRRRFPRFDFDSIADAVVGSVLDIALKLDELDDCENLGGLLYVAAYRRLLAIRRSQQARRSREEKRGKEYVAERQSAAREQLETMGDAELLEQIFDWVPETDEERIVLENWGADYQVIAGLLHWDGLPDAEQRLKVKIIRDRLGKRLKRFIEEPES